MKMSKGLKSVILAVIIGFVSAFILTFLYREISSALSLDILIVQPDSEKSAFLETNKNPYDTLGIEDNKSHAEEEYAYNLLLDTNGNYPVNMSYSGAWRGEALENGCVIAIFKRDGMQSYKINEHVLDQLLYLNDESKKAELLFEAAGKNRIIYGNKQIVTVYNYKKNAVQYISVIGGNVFKEINVNLKKHYSYSFSVNVTDGVIEIEGSPILNSFIDFFDTGRFVHSTSVPIAG